MINEPNQKYREFTDHGEYNNFELENGKPRMAALYKSKEINDSTERELNDQYDLLPSRQKEPLKLGGRGGGIAPYLKAAVVAALVVTGAVAVVTSDVVKAKADIGYVSMVGASVIYEFMLEDLDGREFFVSLTGEGYAEEQPAVEGMNLGEFTGIDPTAAYTFGIYTPGEFKKIYIYEELISAQPAPVPLELDLGDPQTRTVLPDIVATNNDRHARLIFPLEDNGSPVAVTNLELVIDQQLAGAMPLRVALERGGFTAESPILAAEAGTVSYWLEYEAEGAHHKTEARTYHYETAPLPAERLYLSEVEVVFTPEFGKPVPAEVQYILGGELESATISERKLCYYSDSQPEAVKVVDISDKLSPKEQIRLPEQFSARDEVNLYLTFAVEGVLYETTVQSVTVPAPTYVTKFELTEVNDADQQATIEITGFFDFEWTEYRLGFLDSTYYSLTGDPLNVNFAPNPDGSASLTQKLNFPEPGKHYEIHLLDAQYRVYARVAVFSAQRASDIIKLRTPVQITELADEKAEITLEFTYERPVEKLAGYGPFKLQAVGKNGKITEIDFAGTEEAVTLPESYYYGDEVVIKLVEQFGPAVAEVLSTTVYPEHAEKLYTVDNFRRSALNNQLIFDYTVNKTSSVYTTLIARDDTGDKTLPTSSQNGLAVLELSYNQGDIIYFYQGVIVAGVEYFEEVYRYIVE